MNIFILSWIIESNFDFVNLFNFLQETKKKYNFINIPTDDSFNLRFSRITKEHELSYCKNNNIKFSESIVVLNFRLYFTELCFTTIYARVECLYMLEKDSDMPLLNTFSAINVRERKRRSNSRKLALVYLSFYTPNFLFQFPLSTSAFTKWILMEWCATRRIQRYCWDATV